jgi:hypothetical protein
MLTSVPGPKVDDVLSGKPHRAQSLRAGLGKSATSGRWLRAVAGVCCITQGRQGALLLGTFQILTLSAMQRVTMERRL